MVVGELHLPIRHCLLVRPARHAPHITAVVSHPQALAQCRTFIEQQKISTRIPVASTAGAALMVAREEYDHRTAAIASELAAELNGLRVLHRDIQDSSDNATRFHLVGQQPMAPTGCDRTAIIFEVPNAPGSLAKVLQTMANVNLSSIHSVPLQRGEYAFYCEFDQHRTTPAGARIMNALTDVVTRLTVLGSFPQDTSTPAPLPAGAP
jgi:prephenate dehydratase